MYEQGSNPSYHSFAPPRLIIPGGGSPGGGPQYPHDYASSSSRSYSQSWLPSPTGSTSTQDIFYISRSPVGRQEPTHEKPWSTSIFACLKDMKSCFVTTFCPCITSGQVAEIVSEGKTSRLEGVILFMLFSMLLSGCFYTFYTRTKLRRLYKLKGGYCTDCLAHTFFLPCALCQEYRELDHQGFDPALGWRGNIERQLHAVAVFRITPPQQGEMMR